MRYQKTSPATYQRIYDFLVEFKSANDGNTPTYRQIADKCDVSSTSMVSSYLFEMEKVGMIERKRAAGGLAKIIIPGARWLAPVHLKVNLDKMKKLDTQKLMKALS